jgi:hypothetical protein
MTLVADLEDNGEIETWQGWAMTLGYSRNPLVTVRRRHIREEPYSPC